MKKRRRLCFSPARTTPQPHHTTHAAYTHHSTPCPRARPRGLPLQPVGHRPPPPAARPCASSPAPDARRTAPSPRPSRRHSCRRLARPLRASSSPSPPVLPPAAPPLLRLRRAAPSSAPTSPSSSPSADASSAPKVVVLAPDIFAAASISFFCMIQELLCPVASGRSLKKKVLMGMPWVFLDFYFS